jgi:hypothetical protein
MKHSLATAAALIALIFCRGEAAAQIGRAPTNPYQSRPANTYLGLLGPGSRAQNYYTIVRPLQQENADVSRIGQQIAANQQSIAGLQSSELLATGQPVRFMNYQRYFLNLNATASGQLGYAGGSGAFGSSLGLGRQGQGSVTGGGRPASRTR